MYCMRNILCILKVIGSDMTAIYNHQVWNWYEDMVVAGEYTWNVELSYLSRNTLPYKCITFWE